MAGNRKKAEEFLLTFMKKLTPGGGNAVIYQRILDTMDDDQFEGWVQWLEKGNGLAVWASNYNRKEMLNYDHLLKMCDEYGVEIMQRLVVFDEDTGIKSLTPNPYITGRVEGRKQRQMWAKKFSAAKNDYEVDDLTGQVMGDSRSTGISGPEIAVLRNLGLTIMSNELYNVKGGDQDALKAYKNDLITTGKTTTDGSLRKGSGTKVLTSVHHLFRGRHIDTNIAKKTG